MRPRALGNRITLSRVKLEPQLVPRMSEAAKFYGREEKTPTPPPKKVNKESAKYIAHWQTFPGVGFPSSLAFIWSGGSFKKGEARIGATANAETTAGFTSTGYSPPVLGFQETHDFFTSPSVSPRPPLQ